VTSSIWQAIDAHAADLQRGRILDLFAADTNRANAFTFQAPHLTIDVSKERFDARARALMLDLARAQNLEGWRGKMFAGEEINTTEHRAVLHTALRGHAPTRELEDEIETVRARVRAFASDFRGGAITGVTGRALNAIVHIGIGGSDLGPRLVVDALKARRAPGIELRFAANVDGAEIADAIEGLDPERTLVIVVSKTFTTQETLANAGYARAWLRGTLRRDDVSAHLVAVTAAPERAIAWGVDSDRAFPFWDFVGGRYSLWSAVGLSAACALEAGAFGDLIEGAAAMDEHFHFAELEANAPVLAACVHTWNRCALGAASYLCAPYGRRFQLLPAWLQQLEMESNGKRVTRDGAALERPAQGVTWGEPGTNAQHSFFQLIHQGVTPIPVEFICAADGAEGPPSHRALLLSNMLAQAQALLAGKSEAEALRELQAAGAPAEFAPHKTFPGDRPSTIIALDALTPQALGALLAFYEHRTFVQGVLMGVNSFDQWGVELGKILAGPLAGALEGKGAPSETDPSTLAWIERLARKS
jgi:glucose-6-phosphate isomerase